MAILQVVFVLLVIISDTVADCGIVMTTTTSRSNIYSINHVGNPPEIKNILEIPQQLTAMTLNRSSSIFYGVSADSKQLLSFNLCNDNISDHGSLAINSVIDALTYNAKDDYLYASTNSYMNSTIFKFHASDPSTVHTVGIIENTVTNILFSKDYSLLWTLSYDSINRKIIFNKLNTSDGTSSFYHQISKSVGLSTIDWKNLDSCNEDMFGTYNGYWICKIYPRQRKISGTGWGTLKSYNFIGFNILYNMSCQQPLPCIGNGTKTMNTACPYTFDPSPAPTKAPTTAPTSAPFVFKENYVEIRCGEVSQCNDSLIECPAESFCVVTCIKVNACRNSIINASKAIEFSFMAKEVNASLHATVIMPQNVANDSNSYMLCGPKENSCGYVTVIAANSSKLDIICIGYQSCQFMTINANATRKVKLECIDGRYGFQEGFDGDVYQMEIAERWETQNPTINEDTSGMKVCQNLVINIQDASKAVITCSSYSSCQEVLFEGNSINDIAIYCLEYEDYTTESKFHSCVNNTILVSDFYSFNLDCDGCTGSNISVVNGYQADIRCSDGSCRSMKMLLSCISNVDIDCDPGYDRATCYANIFWLIKNENVKLRCDDRTTCSIGGCCGSSCSGESCDFIEVYLLDVSDYQIEHERSVTNMHGQTTITDQEVNIITDFSVNQIVWTNDAYECYFEAHELVCICWDINNIIILAASLSLLIFINIMYSFYVNKKFKRSMNKQANGDQIHGIVQLSTMDDIELENVGMEHNEQGEEVGIENEENPIFKIKEWRIWSYLMLGYIDLLSDISVITVDKWYDKTIFIASLIVFLVQIIPYVVWLAYQLHFYWINLNYALWKEK
eukprot:551739_1